MTVLEVPNFGTVHDAPWLEVCFHEAGHAVVARVLGLPIDEVVARGDGSGWINLAGLNDLPDRTPDQVRAQQVMSPAGALAESMAVGAYAHQSDREAERWHRRISCRTDHAIAENAQQRPGAISMGAAYERAQQLLERHWERVEQVAYALSESGRLTGSEV